MAAKKVTVMVGFVPIPIKLEVAVDEETSGTHTVCTAGGTHDPTRVKQHVDCPSCGKSASSVWGFPERGVEKDGAVVVLTEEEITAANGAPQTGRAGQPPIEVSFHPREKVYGATVASNSVQNVYPDRGGEKGYTLLRDTLAAHPDVVATLIWAPTSKNALWVLEVVDRRLVISKRCWPEQVRPSLDVPTVDVLDMEREMFSQLIEQSVEDFDLGRYVDQSKLSLEELVASRTGVVPATVTGSSGASPVSAVPDLLAAIEASLAKVAKPTPVKRTPAKKAVAKKAAPRKRAAKKTAQPLAKAG